MKLAYYPGCSQETAAVEYSISMHKVAELLGIDLWEIPDWNCCGATSAHSVNELLSLALPARNLAIAEREGMDVVTPCAGCYSRLKATEYRIRQDVQMRNRVQEAIAMNYEARNHTFSILELLVDRVGIDSIQKRVTNFLKGMKPACYYGCLLVRPVEYTGFDDPEDPKSMDNLMRALGAEPVEWSHKSECCGASLTNVQPEIGLKAVYAILKNAVEMGADSIVTACPICMMNLDMRQAQVEKEFKVKFKLPIYYITELVAVACGVLPQKVGVDLHFVEAVSHLNNLALAAQKKVESIEKKRAAVTQRVTENAGRDKAAVAGKTEPKKGTPKLTQKQYEDDEKKAGCV